MVQMDGSQHDGFEGRGPKCVLMVMVDDATNQMRAQFFEEETTRASDDGLEGWVRKHGLVKVDVLAQGGLAAMRDVKASLAKRGVSVDLKALEPWQDPEVWELISGGARAVHHIESPAMTSLCRQCNVRDIDTLIAIVSGFGPVRRTKARNWRSRGAIKDWSQSPSRIE